MTSLLYWGLLSLVTKMKKSIKALGIDDAPFIPRKSKRVKLVAVLMKGAYRFEGVFHTTIQRDGNDSTEKIIELVNNNSRCHQVRLIFTNGINFAGFNCIDPTKIFEKTGKIVISVTTTNPDLESFTNAVKKINNKNCLKVLKNLDPLNTAKPPRGGNVYFHCAGVDPEEAKKILKMFTIDSRLPEPLRIAHMLAYDLKDLLVEL